MDTRQHGSASSGTSVPGDTALNKAVAFYQEALKNGPRLAREVLAEGKRQGHAKRTQERARSRLNIQRILPTSWQGPWMIDLPGDPAVETSKQLRKDKDRKKQQHKGNGRRKQKGGGSSAPHNELPAAVR